VLSLAHATNPTCRQISDYFGVLPCSMELDYRARFAPLKATSARRPAADLDRLAVRAVFIRVGSGKQVGASHQKA
jgi:hypothetical protein